MPPRPSPPRPLHVPAAGLLVACALLLPAAGRGQVPELPPPSSSAGGFTVSIGPGVTTSLTLPGDWTTTLTLALGWSIDDRWTITLAPFWERERDQVDGGTWVYDEISVSVGVSYAFAPRFTVGVDLDFGLVHDAFGPWERNPEFGVGVGVSYAIPLADRWNLVLGPELSWKISDDEWQVGLNTGVSFDL